MTEHTIADVILDTPALLAVLVVVLEAVIQRTRGIGPRRALVYDAIRRRVWRVLDPFARRAGRALLVDKTDEADEYIGSVDASRKRVVIEMFKLGWVWNPLSMVKFLTADGERKYAMSVVERRGEWQQDVHLFATGGGVEVWGHYEPGVTQPNEHVSGRQQRDGDPEGIVADTFAASDLTLSTATG